MHVFFIYLGPLASTVGVSYLAFLKGRKIHSSRDIPNYELYFSEMPTSIVRKQFGLKPEVSRINYLCLESLFILFFVSTKLTFPKHHPFFYFFFFIYLSYFILFIWLPNLFFTFVNKIFRFGF